MAGQRKPSTSPNAQRQATRKRRTWKSVAALLLILTLVLAIYGGITDHGWVIPAILLLTIGAAAALRKAGVID
jgi:fatty acid desaturase